MDGLGYEWRTYKIVPEEILNWVELINSRGEESIRNIIQSHFHWQI